MELSIVILRLVSIMFFLLALVFIWMYLRRNDMSLGGEGHSRSCGMLLIHVAVLIAFIWTQMFTFF